MLTNIYEHLNKLMLDLGGDCDVRFSLSSLNGKSLIRISAIKKIDGGLVEASTYYNCNEIIELVDGESVYDEIIESLSNQFNKKSNLFLGNIK